MNFSINLLYLTNDRGVTRVTNQGRVHNIDPSKSKIQEFINLMQQKQISQKDSWFTSAG